MEKRNVVSRISELQNSAAKSSSLQSQNDEYAKRTTEMQEEIKTLRTCLKQVEVEKNTFERDVAIYITENKNLNDQLMLLKSAHDNNKSTAARWLHEIKDGNQKLMTLREEEYKSNLDCLKDELESSNAEWSEKVKSIEKNNFTLRGEKRDLKKKAEFLQLDLDMHKTTAETSTTNLESTKLNLMRKAAEVQELNKTVKELKTKFADAEKESCSKSMKSKIHIQAIDAKLRRAEEEKEILKEAQKEELRKLRCQLEEREKQLGAQSNINKQMKADLKSEVDLVKEDLKMETEKTKELTTQIMRLEIKIKASSENAKHLDEEYKVKFNSFEEQIAVLQKEVTAKSAKMEELNSELYQSHHTNSDELQDLRNKIVILKNEKGNALNKKTEAIEELESLNKGLNRELESMTEAHKQEIEKLKRDFREKEKHSAAQSCVTRKVQEDMKRLLESGENDLENEKLRSSELCKEIKSLEFKLRIAQGSVKSLEGDNSLKLRLAEEKVSALQQEMAIKDKKMHELQKRVSDAQDMNGKDVDGLTEKLLNAKREKRAAQERISELTEENKRLERVISKAEISGKSQKVKLEFLSLELEQMEKKCKNLEEKCLGLENSLDSRDSTLQRTRDEISHLKATKRSLESENKATEDLDREVSALKKKLFALETTARQTETKLQADIRSAEKEVNDVELEYKEQINDLQEKLSEAQRKLATKNITSVTMCKRVEEDYQKQALLNQSKHKPTHEQTACRVSDFQEIEESRKKESAENLRKDLKDVRKELETVKVEKAAIEEKFEIMRESCSAIETMEAQLEDYHQKCQQLQQQNSILIEKLAVATREKGNVSRRVEEQENEGAEAMETMKRQEKALETLKQTCVMLEEQVVDLEKFNDVLLKNQSELNEEKEGVTKELREVKKKLSQVEHSIALEKRRGLQLEENNGEEIIELQVQAREEANKAQELQDELSDLDRKYKLLDMHANTLQKKLNNEKENSDRLRIEADGYRSRMATLESVRQQTSSGLRLEVERADKLAHEKTALQNEMDTYKMKHSHECIKLNCTIGQQSKLIDFLQAKVETQEPQDKKKKKKKNDLYQVPLQYRELQDMLEESKQTNIQLQQKVNDLRTELQNSKSDVSRLEHGINGATVAASSDTFSPESIAAISAIMKSPKLSSTLVENARSKPRMHHNIPHRLTENVCTRATKCDVCLDSVRFGRVSIKCTECNTWCHVKCRNNMTSSCELPGVVQHYKQGGQIVTASPVLCMTASDGDGNVQGWLKVFCGGSLWEKKWIQLRDGVLIISNSERPITSSKRFKIDANNKDREVIDLVHQQGYLHATVPSSELEISSKADIPYIFKLELRPDTSCWPPRNLYFLSTGFTDKKKWVSAFEDITTRSSSVHNMINDSKVIGNEIVVMKAPEKLEMNCSLPISKEKVLFGCDEGLFVLTPSILSICDRSQLIKVVGAQQILQMDFLKSPNLIVAIEGAKQRVVTFDVQNLILFSGRPSDLCVKLMPVEDAVGCHLLAIGSVEGSPHLCSASATSVQIHRFNAQLGKFVKRKEIATTEPCTCLQFTMCSIIMGTNKFYEIELKSFKVDEFLNTGDQSLLFDHDSLPVAVLQIGENNGKHEYLLCYHEFGVFLDCFGKRTRKDNISWSRLPLSFAYKCPYLIVTHFYSVEILRIARASNYSDDNYAMQQTYLNLPSPRYLGPAITEGAVYLSAEEGGKVSVFCAKGNMKPLNAKENKDGETTFTPKSGLKRRKMHLAASSQESFEDVGSRAKKTQRSPSTESCSTLLSDTTNFSASCDSLLSSNTSRWTDGSKMSYFPPDTPQTSIPKRMRTASYDSLDSIGTITSEATMYSKHSEEDTINTSSGVSSKMMWKPVTPVSGRRQPLEKPVRKTRTPNKLYFEPFEN